MTAIHKALHTYDLGKSIGPWLNAIAHYKTQDQLRLAYKARDHVEFFESDFLPLAPSQELIFSKKKLALLLESLSERERSVVKLLKIEEYSVEETAQKLDISGSNVKVICFRALKKLREALVEEEFYERK